VRDRGIRSGGILQSGALGVGPRSGVAGDFWIGIFEMFERMGRPGLSDQIPDTRFRWLKKDGEILSRVVL
jgi:hypothetical protein